ncbi:MAG: polymorphic toxin-type HINT domain-containing protein [Xenococcaceae cyanobacterium MO_207.B15]|nr:polymorphic toxin-type HINT domain-containing protein [Xenococcaceae cyanobacterium MO_207.B15]
MNQITSSGYSPSTLSKLPAIRTFQTDGGGMGSIPNAVNLFRGDVNLPLELISLPGRGDLDVKVAIMYQSNIQNLVDTWNLEAPTGILGLGWNIPYEMIAIDNKNTGSSYDDEYYLVSGGSANRLHQDGVNLASDTVTIESWNFQTDDYKPWDIRYYPKEEKWVIIKENGVKQIYGGKKDNLPENNPYIQWGIKWGGANGNWIDSTTNTSGQEPFALAWNLAEIENTWGEKVTFSYEVDLKEIGSGGYQYTQATYLKQITALDGRTVTFNYKDKQYDDKVREYQIPHQYPGQSNLHAYQDRYETKFLDSIEVRNEASNSILFSLQFDYELENVSLIDFNNPDFYKRYLTGITQKNADGESLPGYKFEYYTKDISNNTHRGALKNITYPAGGIANFTYDKKNLVGTSHKITIYGNGIPRVWFGSDYVVVAYYDDSRRKLDVKVYSWNGNWISDQPSSGGFNSKLDIDSLQVVTQRDFFALSFKTNSDMKVYLFHQEMGRFGKWSYENYSLNIASSDVQTHLAVGSDFVVFCASGSTELGRYVWNQQSKSWDDKSTTISKGNYILAAWGNYFTIGIYHADSKSCELVLYYQDEIYKQWTRKDIGNISPVEKDAKDNPYFNWSLSNNSATATFIKSFGTNIDYEVRIYTWDAEFNISRPLIKTDSVPQDTKEPFSYSITTGSLVANVGHLWRYNGSDWIDSNQNVSSGNEATKFAYGSDLAIASSSNSTDIKAYDPYRDHWSDPSIEGSWSKDEYHPTISGDLITIGNGIFYRNNQGQLNKDRQSISSEIKPDSIINRAPNYLACETNDGQTQIFFLKNGKVFNTEFLSERIYVDNESSKGKSGTNLAGFNAFVTYKGDDFDQASNLNLYYVFNESIKGNVTDFPVVKVTINDGYQESHTSYDYDTVKIVISDRGIVTQYPHVTVIQGSDNSQLHPFGRTEHLFFNGLSAEGLGFKDFQGNPPYYYSLLHGSLYQQTAYNVTGDQVTRQTVEYEIVTEREKLGESGTIKLYGFYIQQKREESILYGQEISSTDSNINAPNVGIKQEVEYEYDSATGFLKTHTTYNYNSLGEEEILTQTSVYGWEKYEELRKQNILTPVVQTVSKNNDQTTAIAVSTWKDWGEGKWGLYRTYQGLNESAVFEQWNNQNEPNITDWLKVSELISRTSNGVVQDSIDVNGIHSSIILDNQQFYPVAQFTNATIDEATYTGFEAYENLSDWSVNQGNITDLIVTGDAHTGVSSLQLNPNFTLKKQPYLTITNTQQIYIVSAWIKTETGFDTDGGKAEVKLQFNNGNNPVGNPIVVPIESTENKWKYWHHAIDPNQIQGTQLGLEISNQKTSKSFLIDDICFVPLMGGFQGNVYDSKYKILTAKLGNHADTLRYVYDDYQRMIATIGPDENVRALTIPYYSRQGNEVFTPTDPNSSLRIAARNGGIYDNFHDGQWQDMWDGDANGWKVENGALVHVGTQTDQITLKNSDNYSNYGVRVQVTSPETVNQPLGISIGEHLRVQWSSSDGWQVNGDKIPAAMKPVGDWVLVAIESAVLFYVDGQQLFARILDQTVSGAFSLFCGDRVSYQDIVVFQDPITSIDYLDGNGRKKQTQLLEGVHCLVNQAIYDELGRAAVQTKTAQYDNTLFAFESDFAAFNWETGVMQGYVAQYYSATGGGFSDDGGYPYSRKLFENSPLSRVMERGKPGKDFAIANTDNPALNHTLRYEYGMNGEGDVFGEFNFPVNQYLIKSITDPNGVKTYTLKDQAGQIIAKKTLMEPETNEYITLAYEYDHAGRLVTTKPPNYYQPPDGSQPEQWVSTNEYDFLGRLMQSHNPDNKSSRYIYDRVGKPRFMQDANGAAAQSPYILYTKYDRLSRPIEKGYLEYNWDEADLQEKADNPDWPSTPPTWRKLYFYDGDGTSPYAIGELTKILTNNSDHGEPDVEETFTYDVYGDVISKTLKVNAYGDETYITRYQYDNLGNVITITYPNGTETSSESPIEIFYTYDHLGYLQSIGTSPDQPETLAAYHYNANGSLKAELLHQGQITRTYQYNSPGWMTEIADDFFNETLEYTPPESEDKGYYNGEISSIEQAFAWENAPEAYNYRFEYDNIDQLKVAQNNQIESGNLGVGQPVTYDANGNFLDVKRGSDEAQFSYLPGTNQVKNIAGGDEDDFHYDDNGNITAAVKGAGGLNKPLSQLTYDPMTQLTRSIAVEDETVSLVSYVYGGKNQRVLKQSWRGNSPNSAKLYIRGMNSYPLLEKTRDINNGESEVLYIYGPGGLLAMVKNNQQLYYVLKDHEGSSRVVIDVSGDRHPVAASYDYMPFGNLLRTTGDETILSYRYTGQEYEPETGLYNYRARLYDSTLGRFYTIDPAGQFFSPYLYAGNDPILFSDPSGMFSWAAFGAIVGGVAAIAGGIALTFVTAGAATPVLVGAAIGGGALIGAGAGSAIYGATHTKNFNAAEFGIYTGLGAGFGAIGGAAGVGLGAIGLSTGAAFAANIGIGASLGATDGFVTNGSINSLHGKNFLRGGGAAAGYGAAFGAVFGAVFEAAFGFGEAVTPGEAEGLAAERTAATVEERPDAIVKEEKTACFVAGTEVAVEDGFVPIEKIEKGDLVWAFNEDTGEVGLYPVLEAFERTSRYIVLLTFGDEEIITTPEHPFWVDGQGWTPAEGLKQGDILLNKAGEKLSLDKIEMRLERSQVFNFEVGVAHTYYVLKIQILVHNTCPLNNDLTEDLVQYKISEYLDIKQQGKMTRINRAMNKLMNENIYRISKRIQRLGRGYLGRYNSWWEKSLKDGTAIDT